MKIAKRILGFALSLCVLLGSIAGTVACKGGDDPEAEPIDYTIAVACEEEEILAEVRVSLLLNGTAAAEAKSLNNEYKAVFRLKPKTYTVVLSGTDGYTYPETIVTAKNPDVTIRLTAEEPVDCYTVTYAFGGFGGTDYAGSSALPIETDKPGGGKFHLAAALVWDGYTFDGWSDGERVYDAGEEYTMPARAVTLTARWYDCPDGMIRTDVEVPEWNENATAGGYIIEKGQYIQLTASFSGRELEDWTGIVGKAYANSVNNENTFYQFRPDFAIKRIKGSWREDNSGFNVTDTNWDESKYTSLAAAADVTVRYELSEQGVLTYTIEFTSADYIYKRVFTVMNDTMDKAIVFIGAARCTVSNATLVRPMPEGVKLSFDWGYDNLVTLTAAQANSVYTFGADAVRDGYLFLGWQVNGAGEYYKVGDTYSVGEKTARFIAAWEEDAATEGLVFTALADGTYSVKKGTANSETVVIPRTYHNKPVTEIGQMAFMSAKWLKHIVIPDTITKINGSAFSSTNLQEIDIPDSVERIDSSVFSGCAELVSVRVPSGLKSIGTNAFLKCTALEFTEIDGACYIGNEQSPYVVLIKAKDTSITQCNIQSGCEYIYDAAFDKCALLEEVTFPATLRIIGGKTFTGCKSIRNLVIPDSVTGIGGMAFGECAGLQSITIPFIGGGDQGGGTSWPFGYIFGGYGSTNSAGGTSTSQEYLVTGGGYTSTPFYIPNALTSVTVTGGNIPYGAFKNCSNITAIRLSASVKSVGNNAFIGCSALTDVYYDGTEEEWQKVAVGTTGNDPFKDATVHCKED